MSLSSLRSASFKSSKSPLTVQWMEYCVTILFWIILLHLYIITICLSTCTICLSFLVRFLSLANGKHFIFWEFLLHNHLVHKCSTFHRLISVCNSFVIKKHRTLFLIRKHAKVVPKIACQLLNIFRPSCIRIYSTIYCQCLLLVLTLFCFAHCEAMTWEVLQAFLCIATMFAVSIIYGERSTSCCTHEPLEPFPTRREKSINVSFISISCLARKL